MSNNTHLRLVGLSHHTAPLELRERLAVPHHELPPLLHNLRRALGSDAEVALLSTCNRVELYTATPQPIDSADVLAALCSLRGLSATEYTGTTYNGQEEEVARHLFRVAGSLDSLVPGETQILGQVRKAYDMAREQGTARRVLHGLFQRAIAVGKEVMNRTDLAAGRLSVASVAVGYADQIFDHLDDKTVLCVGAGKMARLVLERLRERNVGRLLVCNRDFAKAERFAARSGGEARPLSALDDCVAEADVVVTSTGSREPIITVKRLQPILRRRRYRPLFLIDIAVPRDVESGVADLTNVYLYDVDDLQSAVEQTLASRRESIEAAEQIVDQHVDAYLAWHRGRDVGPTIDSLYRRSHALAAVEVQRLLRKLPDLDDAGRQQVEVMARRLVNKLLHDPVTTLRETRGDVHHAPGYRHAVHKLFALDESDPSLKWDEEEQA